MSTSFNARGGPGTVAGWREPHDDDGEVGKMIRVEMSECDRRATKGKRKRSSRRIRGPGWDFSHSATDGMQKSLGNLEGR